MSIEGDGVERELQVVTLLGDTPGDTVRQVVGIPFAEEVGFPVDHVVSAIVGEDEVHRARDEAIELVGAIPREAEFLEIRLSGGAELPGELSLELREGLATDGGREGEADFGELRRRIKISQSERRTGVGTQRLGQPDFGGIRQLLDGRSEGRIGRRKEAGTAQETLDELTQVGSVFDGPAEVDQLEQFVEKIAEQVALEITRDEQTDRVVRILRIFEASRTGRAIMLALGEAGVTRGPIGHR